LNTTYLNTTYLSRKFDQVSHPTFRIGRPTVAFQASRPLLTTIIIQPFKHSRYAKSNRDATTTTPHIETIKLSRLEAADFWLACGPMPPVAPLLVELEVGLAAENSSPHFSSRDSSSPNAFVTDIGTHENSAGSVKTVVVFVERDVKVRVDV